MRRIYLDNNSTTAVAPEVVEAMLPFFTELYANPSSPHPSGERVSDAVRAARGQVARLVGARPAEIVFTSGGSESINTALAAATRARGERRRIVTSTVEHSAVKASCARLAARGYEHVEIGVDAHGVLDRSALEAALGEQVASRGQVAFVSLLLANNETGVLTDLEGVAGACRAAGALLHVDAVQAPGKMPLDAPGIGCDLMSLAAHKFHGPKGVGCVYVRSGLELEPLVVGGPQEGERRAGTENVPGIVGMGRAAELAAEHARDADGRARVGALRDRLEARILAGTPGARVHGAVAARLPSTSNILFPGTEAAVLLALLGEAGVEASAGSACNATRSAPSPVLLAMGASPEEASASLRFSLSRYTTADEVEAAAAAVLEAMAALGAL